MIQAARLLLIALLLRAATGCVTTADQPPARPLPDGVYQHKVTVYNDDSPDQGVPGQFHGVLKLAQGKLSLVLLTAFDTTLVRITDDIAKTDPAIEVYEPELARRQIDVLRLYMALKPALIDIAATDVAVFGRHVDVQHRQIDAAGVPHLTTMSYGSYRITVEVTQFQPDPVARSNS